MSSLYLAAGAAMAFATTSAAETDDIVGAPIPAYSLADGSSEVLVQSGARQFYLPRQIFEAGQNNLDLEVDGVIVNVFGTRRKMGLSARMEYAQILQDVNRIENISLLEALRLYNFAEDKILNDAEDAGNSMGWFGSTVEMGLRTIGIDFSQDQYRNADVQDIVITFYQDNDYPTTTSQVRIVGQIQITFDENGIMDLPEYKLVGPAFDDDNYGREYLDAAGYYRVGRERNSQPALTVA